MEFRGNSPCPSSFVNRARPMPFKGEETKRLRSHVWFGTAQPLVNPLVLQGSLCMRSAQPGVQQTVLWKSTGEVGYSLKSHFLKTLPRQVRGREVP